MPDIKKHVPKYILKTITTFHKIDRGNIGSCGSYSKTIIEKDGIVVYDGDGPFTEFIAKEFGMQLITIKEDREEVWH